MGKKGKEFVVSVADFAYYVDDVLACTGTTNLSSTISVTMQEKAVNAGNSNKKIFSYKYGRELSATLEAADWRLEYIAMQTGSLITKKLADYYHINECLTVTNGSGSVEDTPVGKVGIELPNGMFVEVSATGKQVDLTKFGISTGTVTVHATYKYKQNAKQIVIDADSEPFIGKLVLSSEKHNSKKGKVGSVEIIIPSYALDGNFELSFTPDGVVSTKLSGSALAVEGDSCDDGGSVYAYITEIDIDEDETNSYSEIVLIAPSKSVAASGTIQLSVEGIISAMYKPVELDATDVTFAVSSGGSGSVSAAGLYTAGSSAGSATITATYGTLTDTVTITVTGA